MEIRDIITLDNGADYLLVEEYELDNNKFFLAVGVDEEEALLDDQNIQILYAGEDEEGEFVEVVEDEKILQQIYAAILTEEVAEDDPEFANKVISVIEEKLQIEGSK